MSNDANIDVRRLNSADQRLAQQTFRMMAEVFDEGVGDLSDRYVASLLGRRDFWAMVALHGGVPVGGITAHVLLMTRSEAEELFIYDLAVHRSYQRHGIGRRLVETLCRDAASAGVPVAFVPADVEDDHAVTFYQALGGTAAEVIIFSFDRRANDRPAAT